MFAELPSDQRAKLVGDMRNDKLVRAGMNQFMDANVGWYDPTIKKFKEDLGEPVDYPMPGHKEVTEALDDLKVDKTESPYFNLAASMARGMAGGV
jgi:hypothetical protein